VELQQLGWKNRHLDPSQALEGGLMTESSEVGTTANPYKGYIFRIGGPNPKDPGKVVQVWQGELIVHRTSSIDAAIRWVDRLEGS
jgi:hypothetical protein